MKSKKKIIIILICVFCILALSVGVSIVVYQRNKSNIKFTIHDNLEDGNGEKVRVVLLAGQSNASGCSRTDYLESNVSETKFDEYQNGYANIYINFYDDQNVSNGFVNAKTNQGFIYGHFGPELGMAEKLHELYPDEKIFIIKFAIGGTNLYSEWLSPSSDGPTGYLYTNFIRFTKQSLNYLKSKNYTPVVEAMCWMQGESDSFSTKNATNYETNLANLIADTRHDLSKYASKDGIAFVDAYIANIPNYWVYCDLVNNSKKLVAESSDMNVVIDTNAYGLTTNKEPTDNPDMAHYDSLSQIKLGNLFAEEASKFFD